jgi:hypothetical protein
VNGAESFGEWAELWLNKHKMAESTRDMRRSVYQRDRKKPFASLMTWEITHEDLRRLCDKIIERGAPATAAHAREIVLMVYCHANKRGHKHENPANLARPCSIAIFQPRDHRSHRKKSGCSTGILSVWRQRRLSGWRSSFCY